jgi:hypothetical protein
MISRWRMVDEVVTQLLYALVWGDDQRKYLWTIRSREIHVLCENYHGVNQMTVRTTVVIRQRSAPEPAYRLGAFG